MQNRIRYLLLFTMSLVFFLSAIPAVNAFEGISAGNFQMEENSPGAADLEIKTYQDIPYTGQFPASVGEAGGEVSVVKQPRKGTVVLDGDKFTYMPKAGKTGADRFTYAVTNAEGVTSAPATVSIQIEKRRSQVTYSDMEGNSGYSAAVALAEQGVYIGHRLGEEYFFEPDALVSRSEFLAMAMETVGVPVDTDVLMTGFSDDAAIPVWTKCYAVAAVNEGVLRGISTEEGIAFRGENMITLQEAAVIMDRLLDVADVSLENGQLAWADQALANMESVRIVSAGSFGSQTASEPVTMVQAAEMLAAAMDLIEQQTESPSLLDWFS